MMMVLVVISILFFQNGDTIDHVINEHRDVSQGAKHGVFIIAPLDYLVPWVSLPWRWCSPCYLAS